MDHEPRPTQIGTKTTREKVFLIILLAVLAVVSLVTSFMLLVPLLNLALLVGHYGPQPTYGESPPSVWGSILLLVFFTPMWLLFVRGSYVVFEELRGHGGKRLISKSLAWMVALTYGLPGLVAGPIAFVLHPSGETFSFIFAGLEGALLIAGAPFLMAQLDKKEHAKKLASSHEADEHDGKTLSTTN